MATCMEEPRSKIEVSVCTPSRLPQWKSRDKPHNVWARHQAGQRDDWKSKNRVILSAFTALGAFKVPKTIFCHIVSCSILCPECSNCNSKDAILKDMRGLQKNKIIKLVYILQVQQQGRNDGVEPRYSGK